MNANLLQKKNIHRSISQHYLLAVLIIALLSTAAYYTLGSALSDSDSTAYIVNLSGRQRMLSQHIALDAHRFYAEKSFNDQANDELVSLMKKNINDMEKSNRQLSSGLLSENRVIDLSMSIRDMYFGKMNIYDRVSKYLEISKKLLSSTNNQEALASIRVIDSTSEQLLKDLNTIVNQYQLEGEARLETIEKLELLVWLTTLIVIFLEVLLIFRPMVSLVIAAQRAQTNTMDNLEEIVESRTLKLELANQKLKEIAIHDPLTKLRNRLTLEADVESLMSTSKLHNIPFAFCMIDIDWFKKVNDTYGHLAGDYILKEIALLFKEFIRESDHLYRAGGEEFVLVLNRVNFEEALAKLEKLRQTVQEHHFDYKGQHIALTISAGLYHSNQFTLSRVHDVILTADKALYMAKNNGRNCIQKAQSEDFSYSTNEKCKQSAIGT